MPDEIVQSPDTSLSTTPSAEDPFTPEAKRRFQPVVRALNLPPDVPPYDINTIYTVPIQEIFCDDQFNSRGRIDAEDVQLLARDILEKGLLFPILLQPWTGQPDKKFRIIAGHRRFKAMRLNTFHSIDIAPRHVPATIKADVDELQARVMNLCENLQRKQLNIKQEAKAIWHFQLAGWSEKDVADQLGVSINWVQIRYMLLELPEEIQDEVSAGQLTQQNIRDLAKLDDRDKQFEMVRALKNATSRYNNRIDQTVVAVRDKNIDRRVIRNVEEITNIQGTIREYIGNGLATIALGWAMGYASDYDLHYAIHTEAAKHDRYYPMPELRPEGQVKSEKDQNF